MPHPPSVSALEAHLGYWLRFVSNHVSNAFRQKVEAEGVTVAEWVVLRALFDVGARHPSEIAASLGMTRGTISKLAARLAEKRLIQIAAAGDTASEAVDRRFQTLRLTAAGRKKVPVLGAIADRNDAQFFAGLTASQRADLMALLQQIVQAQGLNAVPVD